LPPFQEAGYDERLRMRRPIIIAHRGVPAFARENTIASFQKAIELRADMIELDVRRTKDHVLIAHHDAFMEGNPVRDLVYKEMFEMARDQGFSLPTLEEVLQWTKGKIGLDVELKEEGVEKQCVELLLKYFNKDQFIITSFHDSCVKRIKEDHPDLKVGLILGIGKPKFPTLTLLSELFPIRRYKKAKADFLVPNWELLRFGFLKRMKRKNVPVFVWTVNDEEMIRKLLQDERVDGIITDRPDLALSLRQTIDST
jgi:glycerophosphoryl diester phosphodiesterase